MVVSRDVAEALPEQIQPVIPNDKKAPEAEDETLNTEIRDFPLPLQHKMGNLSLRQVIQARETARITELWWALTRCSITMRSMEHPSYADGNLALRVLGTMFRPQGAFWIAMKILNF